MNYQKRIYALLTLLIVFSGILYWISRKEMKVYSISIPSIEITESAPPCLQMYDAIIKYSDKYKIPRKYAFGIAYEETSYQGPFHWKYRHAQTSFAGAVGPMQIMPSTGRFIWKDSSFTNRFLMTNIDFNVHTSMKLLRKLHDRYRDWKIVFGCYNTGRPVINDYAIHVFNHKPNWSIK